MMKNLLKITFGLSIIMMTMSFTYVADFGGEWQRLGSRTVNMRADHDEIPVTAFKGAFTKLKFRVKGAPIHVKNVRIVFGNGNDQNFKIDRKFAPGTESRVLDLPGNKRVIKKIVMNYRSVQTPKGKAEVVVWGKH